MVLIQGRNQQQPPGGKEKPGVNRGRIIFPLPYCFIGVATEGAANGRGNWEAPYFSDFICGKLALKAITTSYNTLIATNFICKLPPSFSFLPVFHHSVSTEISCHTAHIHVLSWKPLSFALRSQRTVWGSSFLLDSIFKCISCAVNINFHFSCIVNYGNMTQKGYE